MALKQGRLQYAVSEYEAILSSSTAPSGGTKALVERKLIEAKAQLHDESAAQTTQERSSARMPEPPAGVVESLMAFGQRANAAGEVAKSRALFDACYVLSRKLEARISAANMTLKLGEVTEAKQAYEEILATGSLSAERRTYVERKLAEAEAKLPSADGAAADSAPAENGQEAMPTHDEKAAVQSAVTEAADNTATARKEPAQIKEEKPVAGEHAVTALEEPAIVHHGESVTAADTETAAVGTREDAAGLASALLETERTETHMAAEVEAAVPSSLELQVEEQAADGSTDDSHQLEPREKAQQADPANSLGGFPPDEGLSAPPGVTAATARAGVAPAIAGRPQVAEYQAASASESVAAEMRPAEAPKAATSEDVEVDMHGTKSSALEGVETDESALRTAHLVEGHQTEAEAAVWPPDASHAAVQESEAEEDDENDMPVTEEWHTFRSPPRGMSTSVDPADLGVLQAQQSAKRTKLELPTPKPESIAAAAAATANGLGLRLIVVGDSGAGKTALLRRFASDVFDEDEATSTIAVDVTTTHLQMGDQSVKLELYDTAGQERFAPMCTPYYRRAEGIIYVFDVTNTESLHSIENHWQSDVLSATKPGVPAVLAGCKVDLEGREVTEEEAREVAQRLGVTYVDTSAKTGENVHDAIYLLTCSVMNRRLQDDPRFSSTIAMTAPVDDAGVKGCAC